LMRGCILGWALLSLLRDGGSSCVSWVIVVCGGFGCLCRGVVSDGCDISLVCSWSWLSSFLICWLSLVVVGCVVVLVDGISGLPLCCFFS